MRAFAFIALLLAIGGIVLAQQPTPILPDPKLTPGDTFDVTAADLCVPGYAKKVRNDGACSAPSGPLPRPPQLAIINSDSTTPLSFISGRTETGQSSNKGHHDTGDYRPFAEPNLFAKL